MACNVYLFERPVMYCSNGWMRWYFEKFEQEIEKRHITNVAILDALYQLDQDNYGAGCIKGDIGKIFRKHEDLSIFLLLVDAVIKRARNTSDVWRARLLLGFRSELQKYYAELLNPKILSDLELQAREWYYKILELDRIDLELLSYVYSDDIYLKYITASHAMTLLQIERLNLLQGEFEHWPETTDVYDSTKKFWNIKIPAASTANAFHFDAPIFVINILRDKQAGRNIIVNAYKLSMQEKCELETLLKDHVDDRLILLLEQAEL